MTPVGMLYYAMTAFFAVILCWNFIKTRDAQQAVLYLVILMPFVMRILRLK